MTREHAGADGPTPSPAPAPELRLARVDADSGVGMQLEVERAAADVPAAPVDAAVKLFADASNGSMFSRGREACLVVHPMPAAPPATLIYRWSIAGVEPASLRVLANLLDTLSEGPVPLRTVRLRPEPPRPSATELGRAELCALGYPIYPKPPPFALQLKHRLSGAKDYLIRVVFDRALTDAEFDQLESGFVVWDRLITHGGFGNNRGEVQLDDTIACSQTYMAAPDTLEHEFVRGIGQSGAFAALVNLVIGFGRTLAEVRRLEIT